MIILSVLNQKGGVGKSTLARALAVEITNNKQSVLLADLDTKQGSSVSWAKRRQAASIKPHIDANPYKDVKSAIAAAEGRDVLIIDGKPHASQAALTASQNSDLVIIPTGLATDDLEPTVSLAHELVAKGIPQNRIVIAFNSVLGDVMDPELKDARLYVADAGYYHLLGSVPLKKAFRRAQDAGLAIQETRYPSLNKRVDQVLQCVFDRIGEAS